jgi:hypothetical protein
VIDSVRDDSRRGSWVGYVQSRERLALCSQTPR